GEILRGRPEVPIVATAAVRRAIERDDAAKNAIVGPMMGDEWPTQRQFPNRTVVDSVELGGLSFSVRDLGAAESPADSLWFLDERSIFVGDLVYNGLHAYLADGHYEGWLACLDQMQSSLARGAILYVGHGQPGGLELLAAQKRYVEAFVASVQANLAMDPDARRAAVVGDMKRLLPTEGLSFLMELSVDPVAASLEGGTHAP
ncbi:MAG TPA: hypothetical protein VFU02_02260, partial [Polyangiaceae bacterium]|nr:hypothetical protein [Polyangiaceae bacterium]